MERTRTCPGCTLPRAYPEEFPIVVGRKRTPVCVRCMARAPAPMTCQGCGAKGPPDAHPLMPKGNRSVYCHACHLQRDRPRCSLCKEGRPQEAFHRWANGRRSRSCDNCRRAQPKAHTCSRCKKQLPRDAFHKYRSNTLARACHDCRRVRPHGVTKRIAAPSPCKSCGQPIVRDEPPSRLKNRKYCSEACTAQSRRRQDRACVRCRRKLPFDAFDGYQQRRNRRASCRECLAADTADTRTDVVMRLSPRGLDAALRHAAKTRGVPYALQMARVEKLRHMPCFLCGNPTSTVHLVAPKEGYTASNCRPVCRICRRMLTVLPAGELMLFANEVALHHPLDVNVGCLKCRCARRKALNSSKPCASSAAN